MAAEATESTEFTDLKRQFTEFLDQEEDQGGYKHKVRQILEQRGKKSYRLIVNLDDLRNWNDELVKGIINKPQESHVAFQSALAETAQGMNPDLAKTSDTIEFYVGYEGSFGSSHVTPRGLTSGYISQLVCVEGIATKIGLVKPKIVQSVHFCPATQKSHSMVYRDETSLVGDSTSSLYPTVDAEGNALETEYGFSTYRNHQRLTIQEMPEHAPMGQIPCSTSVILDDDLADSCKPGDRVQIVGIYRGLAGGQSGTTDGMFRTSILATNVRVLTKDVSKESFTSEDEENIKEVQRMIAMTKFLSHLKNQVKSIFTRNLCACTILFIRLQQEKMSSNYYPGLLRPPYLDINSLKKLSFYKCWEEWRKISEELISEGT